MPSSDGGQPEQQGKPFGISAADGASATSVSSVSTPPAGEESAKQLASGPHSEGTQTVNGNSPSDGNQTVEAEAGGESEAEDGPSVPAEVRASSGEHGETAVGTNEQEEVQPQVKKANAAVLSSNIGNVSQGNNSDAGTMRVGGLLPLLVVGLWGFAAL
ncbi:trans-sialidase, putative [Trypanosoma cruzi marinkellei]|uniref:Trans-sialidase, putative n=1 Tax=Trypanosoma cruzi marinkellei TaxID=85056 RepID=K2M2P8_TRYCR|nr:trans-sialidase, putative [Trypanosoma cruzi marinkellei]